MSKTVRLIILTLVLATAVFAIFFRKSSEDSHWVAESAEQAEVHALPKLIDLGSTTCIPCKKMEPILASLSENYAGQLEVEFINIHEDKEATNRYDIRLIPTQIFFDSDGQELFRHEGFFPMDEILAKWDELGVALDGSPQS